jgi:hypothetical protein
MPNIEFQGLPATTTLATGDIIPTTTNPGGSAIDKKITYGNFFKTPPAQLMNRKGADVASANDLTLGSDGNFFSITGTATINGIATANWQPGTEICLWFQGAATLANNATPSAGFGKLFLSKSQDLVCELNTVVQFRFDGTNWQETSRKSPS